MKEEGPGYKIIFSDDSMYMAFKHKSCKVTSWKEYMILFPNSVVYSLILNEVK